VSQQKLASLAIHGLGGVEKTQIALEYAYRVLDGFQAVLWFSSENAPDLATGFTKIAMELNLPGAKPQNDPENRVLVPNWLKRTEIKWLLFFDNAGEPLLLRPF
jgi:hypothetical protein